MDIFIDFDGCISPKHFPMPLDEPPFDGCIEAIQRLHSEGNHITIFSCRFNRELFGNSDAAQNRIEQEMLDYLQKYEIPFHEIYRGKPHYHILIDDRGFKAASSEEWSNVIDFVHGEAKPHTLHDDPEERANLYNRFD
jgi:hypothetical protein